MGFAYRLEFYNAEELIEYFKGKLSGNLVSHSNRKTPRLYSANVQKVRVVNDGVVSSEYVCARCLKSKKVERA